MIRDLNELRDEAERLWWGCGDNAPLCNFRTTIEDRGGGKALVVIVDLPGVGHKESVTVRMYVDYPIVCTVLNDETTYAVPRLEEYLKAFYLKLDLAAKRSVRFGVKDF